VHPDTEAAERLDQYVVGRQPGLSRSYAAHLIKEGRVKVNGVSVTKASHRVRPGDKIDIEHDPAQAEIPEIDLPVLYEDRSCVVIDKPAGILTHSKGGFNPEATVATWLAGRTEGMTGERAGIVHRLDRATSGVMICAKNAEALDWLQKQFSERRAVKTYMAVVDGQPEQPEAVIDMPIERNPKRPQTFRTGPGGRTARTAYKVLRASEGGEHSLLRLNPTTGRTHQLRVHLAKIGHPITGDALYGGSPAPRLFLHALSLEITLPDRQKMTFEATLPAGFEELVRA
jgi:23S rRNA pseudouridine1911/1915/1917 synthase